MILILLLTLSVHAHQKEPHGDAKAGTGLYSNCFYCHSLKPDVHLTGPSLANLWEKKSGQVKGYNLYSDAMKKSSVVWNEDTLRKWVETPASVIPGTSMPSNITGAPGISDLVAFLKVAMGPDGHKKVVEQKMVSLETADGQLPKDLSQKDAQDTIARIEHCSDFYTLTMKDGTVTRHWEPNLDFKIRSGKSGPPAGKPVRVSTGSMGDRFSVVFHDSREIAKFVKKCK